LRAASPLGNRLGENCLNWDAWDDLDEWDKFSSQKLVLSLSKEPIHSINPSSDNPRGYLRAGIPDGNRLGENRLNCDAWDVLDE
jgi:hypothetical protein